MAQFRAVIRGQRGEASRLGSKSSGIVAHVDGWNAGVTVHAEVDMQGRDVFTVYRTAGSNGYRTRRVLATFADNEPAVTSADGAVLV